MRVIAGRYKGHQLKGFHAPHIRPTTDRVKESIFNTLMYEIEGARFLDLFAGTGSLGIEALSRGASEVVFVEKSKKSVQIIEQNLSKLKIVENIKIVNKDVFSFLKDFSEASFDIVMADPPFTEKIAHSVMESLVMSGVVSDESTLIIESSKHERIDDSYKDWYCYRFKDFGDKAVSYFTKGEENDQ